MRGRCTGNGHFLEFLFGRIKEDLGVVFKFGGDAFFIFSVHCPHRLLEEEGVRLVDLVVEFFARVFHELVGLVFEGVVRVREFRELNDRLLLQPHLPQNLLRHFRDGPVGSGLEEEVARFPEPLYPLQTVAPRPLERDSYNLPSFQTTPLFPSNFWLHFYLQESDWPPHLSILFEILGFKKQSFVSKRKSVFLSPFSIFFYVINSNSPISARIYFLPCHRLDALEGDHFGVGLFRVYFAS